MTSCIEKERQALLDVKANLNDFDGLLDDWGSQDEKMDCCKWEGVRCNHHTGHVIELDLSDVVRIYNSYSFHDRATGKISPSLQVLNHLEYLNLNSIDFQSNPLPNFLASLSNLQRLHISDANLRGPFPHQLVNLSNLLHLDLSHNSLKGSIPISFGDLTSLTYLDLSQNQIEGVIPKSFGNCSSLVHLDLSQNFLSGSLPSFAGCSSLTNLSLAHNSLNGTMPDFTQCTSLQKLDLSSNFLIGNIPNRVGQLSNLEYLDVSHNSLKGSMLDFAGCTSLQILDLSSNFLSGNIPSNVAQLSNLKYLNVASNYLNGSIPNFIGRPSLWFLDMSSNELFGSVPNSLGQGSNLEFLDFSSNSLEGVMSDVHFLHLTKLYYLDLSFNSLSLNLSIHKRILPQLSTIKLQYCKLGPRFPMWIKTQEYFTHLDISNAGISDGIPAWFWGLSSGLKFLNLSSNEIKGMLPDMSYLETFFDGFPGMDLSNNQFEGRVPSLPLPLAALNLSGNKFSGSLSFLCDIERAITFLDLSNNSFTGSLPDCWLKFRERLVILNLSNNNLSGEIPFSLGSLSNLESLYLRTNSFVGEIPMSLSNCTRLRFVDLRENKLSGVIPGWIGEKLSKLYVLVLGSNKFKGRLPSKICRLYNLRVLDLSNNGLSGNIPRCLDKFTAMARTSFEDDVSNHSYYSYVGDLGQPDLACVDHVDYEGYLDPGYPSNCPYESQQARFFDNTWVTWKGTERCGFPPVVEKKDVEEDEDDFWKSYYTGMGSGFAVGFLGICSALVLNRRYRYFFFALLSHMKDWVYVTVVVYFGKLERKFRR
ncbi:hypothetical protein L1987_24313 [Smallanthus sonchifolius]|uniref:Uncharacterized protein n=1 Tax=Smallanthus sonchifolius TaxID=185202 RepID=A0ACB9IK20_9ASTR|nr:hypothetical protein L1987_24313 [Smallanthus sonchifolius]